MINSWSLLYDELYGDDEMTEDIKITTGTGQTVYNVPEGVEIEEVDDTITIEGGAALGVDEYPTAFTTLSDNDDSIAHHLEASPGDFVNFNLTDDLTGITTGCVDTLNISLGDYDDPFVSASDYISFGGEDEKPKPGIESDNPRKYKEDESIKALQEYISTTYGGHYTSENNNVQTLDLIESVGDAESFCRSNAIKYLSRYDKKGQAKRDILKALHYTLLLYHFSGQLNETTTCGYETF